MVMVIQENILIGGVHTMKKIFVLGRPGSGKSTASRLIASYIEQHNHDWSAPCINDYEFLYKMFEADTGHRKFRPASYGGFIVVDFSVLDSALSKIERRAQEFISTGKPGIILIEFARDDYERALRQFTRDFLYNAYILFLDADIEVCIERIRRRVAYSATSNDHFVDDVILKSYYSKQYMPSKLPEIGNEKVKIIDNNGSRQDFLNDVYQFIYAMLEETIRTL